MKLNVEINDKSKSKIRREFILKVIKNTLLQAELDILRNKIFSVSVALVNESEIKNLNKVYRHINSATDVLSFPEYQSAKKLAQASDKDIFLGELILCYNNICDWSYRNKLNSKQELARTISHGVLHLLGFRHGKKMFQIQNDISKI